MCCTRRKKITTCCLVIHSCCHFPCSPPSSKMIQFFVSAAEKSWWIHIHVPRRCLNQHHTITGWESSGAVKCEYLYTQLCVNIHKWKGFSMLFFFLETLCSFSFCTFWTWPDTSFSRRLQALSLQKRACFGESKTAPTHLFLFDITIKRRKSFLSEDLSVPVSNGLERRRRLH